MPCALSSSEYRGVVCNYSKLPIYDTNNILNLRLLLYYEQVIQFKYYRHQSIPHNIFEAMHLYYFNVMIYNSTSASPLRSLWLGYLSASCV